MIKMNEFATEYEHVLYIVYQAPPASAAAAVI